MGGVAKVGLSAAELSRHRLGLTWWPVDGRATRDWLRVLGWIFVAQTLVNTIYLAIRGVGGLVVFGLFTVPAIMSALPRLDLRWRALSAAVALGVAPLVTLGLPGGELWVNINLALAALLVLGFRSIAALILTIVTEATFLLFSLVNGETGPFGHALLVAADVRLADDALRLLSGTVVVLILAFVVVALFRSGQRETAEIHARTWQVLDELTSTTAGNDLEDAAQQMLETLCDEQWPVGHLWWGRGEEFSPSTLWSQSSRALPAFREAIERQGAVRPESGALVAGSAGGLTVWASWEGGTYGSVSQSATPGRQVAMREAGLGTTLFCPVFASGQVVALIEMCGYPSYSSTPPETLLLQTAAALLSRVAEREAAVETTRAEAALANATLDVFPDGVLVADSKSGRVLDHNEQMAELLRERSTTSILGHRVETLLPGITEGFADNDTAVISLRDVQLEVKRAEVVIGGRHETLLFVRDLTSREAAEEHLELTTARYRAMTSAAKVGILELDANNAISFANDAGAALFGLSVDDVLDRKFVDLVPFGQELLDAADQAAAPAWLNGEVTAKGRTFPAMASAVPTLVRGRRAGAIVTIADASRVAQQTALIERQEHARELNDTVAQGLVETLYLLEEGEVQEAARVAAQALTSARDTIATLLSDTPLSEATLLRRRAASGEQQ